MHGDDEEVDSGWGELEGEPAPSANSEPPAGVGAPIEDRVTPTHATMHHAPTPPFGVPPVRPVLHSTPAFGMLAPPGAAGGVTPPHGTPAAEPPVRARTKTPVGGLEAPRGLSTATPSRPIAAPRATPDRATMPPPMPEEEYIERVLAMDDGELPPPRKRLNTLVEHDPLQYDAPAPADENSRPTKPPEAPPATRRAASDAFLDLELDLGDGGPAAAPAASAPLPRPAPLPVRPAVFPTRPPAPGSAPPPTVRAEDLDDLPIDQVLDSIPPGRVGAFSVRPGAGPSGAPPMARPAAPESSKVRPSPATMRNPPGAKTYDSSPVIEVVTEDAALEMGVAPRPALAPGVVPRRPASARPPPAKTPPAGTAIVPEARRSNPPPSEPPTLALQKAARSADSPIDKVLERIEAGDFGRALMLAEQTIAGGDLSPDLQHYAELCREKLRQTYLERIGSGRTILRVAVDPDTLRSRALDPRLAFLLSLLDGASTVDDVIDMSTMPALEAVRALHELMQEGVVEIVPTRRRQAP